MQLRSSEVRRIFHGGINAWLQWCMQMSATYGIEQLSYNNTDAYYSFPVIAPSSSLRGGEGQVQHEQIRQAPLCRESYLAA